MIFFTSDIHFFWTSSLQAKVDREKLRPFDSVDEMHETFISNWNEVVTNNDTVYHLGDLTFGRPDATALVIDKLRFKDLILLKGNHDDSRAMRKIVEHLQHRRVTYSGTPYEELRIVSGYKENRKATHQYIILDHYPLRSWNRMHYGSWMLFGHCHGNLENHGLSADVGVDSPHILGHAGYRPYSIDEVEEYMRTRTINVVDHHVPPTHAGE